MEWGAIYSDFSSGLKVGCFIDAVDPYDPHDQFHLPGYSLDSQKKYVRCTSSHLLKGESQ